MLRLTGRRRRARPLRDSLALKWFCPGARAMILPVRVTRSRLVYDLLVFIVLFIVLGRYLRGCLRGLFFGNRHLGGAWLFGHIPLQDDREALGALLDLVCDFIRFWDEC